MQAKLLTEEPHFYVPLPNPNLIHHLPPQMYFLSYIMYLSFCQAKNLGIILDSCFHYAPQIFISS